MDILHKLFEFVFVYWKEICFREVHTFYTGLFTTQLLYLQHGYFILVMPCLRIDAYSYAYQHKLI